MRHQVPLQHHLQPRPPPPPLRPSSLVQLVLAVLSLIFQTHLTFPSPPSSLAWTYPEKPCQCLQQPLQAKFHSLTLLHCPLPPLFKLNTLKWTRFLPSITLKFKNGFLKLTGTRFPTGLSTKEKLLALKILIPGTKLVPISAAGGRAVVVLRMMTSLNAQISMTGACRTMMVLRRTLLPFSTTSLNKKLPPPSSSSVQELFHVLTCFVLS